MSLSLIDAADTLMLLRAMFAIRASAVCRFSLYCRHAMMLTPPRADIATRTDMPPLRACAAPP